MLCHNTLFLCLFLKWINYFKLMEIDLKDKLILMQKIEIHA